MAFVLTLTKLLRLHVTQVFDLVLGHDRSILGTVEPIEGQWGGTTAREMEVGKYSFTGVIVGVAQGGFIIRFRFSLRIENVNIMRCNSPPLLTLMPNRRA